MIMNKFNLLLAAVFVLLMAGVGLSYYGSQPATPADIAAAITKLEPQQKEKFARYITATFTTVAPNRIGKPLTRSDLSDAVDFARGEDTDIQLRDAQERALSTVLPPLTNTQEGMAK